MDEKKRHHFPAILGKVTAWVVMVCASACIISLCVAAAYKLITWLF